MSNALKVTKKFDILLTYNIHSTLLAKDIHPMKYLELSG